MRFLTPITAAFFALGSCVAHAGYFTVTSFASTTYVPASSIALHTVTSANNTGTKNFNLELTIKPSPGGTGSLSATTLTNCGVHVVVEWHPSVGDPNPGTWDAYWTSKQTAHVQAFSSFRPSGASIGASGVYGPDPGPKSFNQNFVPGVNYLDFDDFQTTNFLSGAFNFTFSGGKWIGTGDFAIGLSVALSGSIPPWEWGGIDLVMKQDMELTKIGNYAVM